MYFEIPETAELEIISAESAIRKLKLIVSIELKTKATIFIVEHSIEGRAIFDTIEDAVEIFNILQ
jgi:hypothetical protein